MTTFYQVGPPFVAAIRHLPPALLSTASLSVAPTLGAIIATGFAPRLDFTVTPAAGLITATGVAPNASAAMLPGAGSIVATGQAPTVNTTTAPTAGAVTATGIAPRVDRTVIPAAGSIVATGQAPTANATTAPGVGSLVATGLAPTAGITASPGAGSVAATGIAPRVDRAAAPASGSIVLTGFAPTAGSTFAVTPAVGTINLAGFVSRMNVTVAPSVGRIAVQGTTAPASTGENVTAEIAAILQEFDIPLPSGPGDWMSINNLRRALLQPRPSASAGLPHLMNIKDLTKLIASAPRALPSTPHHVWINNNEVDYSGPGPAADDIDLLPLTSLVTIAGSVPRVDQNIISPPPAGAIFLTGFVPVIDLAASRIFFTGFSPSININQTVAPGRGSIAFTGKAPSGNTNVAPGVGSAIATGVAPRIDRAVAPGIGLIVLSGFAPAPVNGIQPTIGSVVFTGFSPLVNRVATPPTGSVLATGVVPVMSRSVLPGVGSVVLTGIIDVVTMSSPPLAGDPSGVQASRVADMMERFGFNIFADDGSGNTFGSSPAVYTIASVTAAYQFITGSSGMICLSRGWTFQNLSLMQNYCPTLTAATGTKWTMEVGGSVASDTTGAIITMATQSHNGTGPSLVATGWMQWSEGFNEPNGIGGETATVTADGDVARVNGLMSFPEITRMSASIVFGLPTPDGSISGFLNGSNLARTNASVTMWNVHYYPSQNPDFSDGSTRRDEFNDVFTGINTGYGTVRPQFISEFHPTLFHNSNPSRGVAGWDVGVPAWAAHSFALNERTTNAGNVYQAIVPGRSAAAPTGTSADFNYGGAGTTGIVWNAADKTANITLSTDAFTATITSTAQGGVRSTTSKIIGKVYFEFTPTTTTPNQGMGFANSIWDETDINGLGDNNSVGIDVSGFFYINNVQTATVYNPWVIGTPSRIAIDFDNKLIWMATGAGLWNNLSTANPVTGAGGFSFAGLAAGPYFVAFGDGANSGDSITVNLGFGAFFGTPPAGYKAWAADDAHFKWQSTIDAYDSYLTPIYILSAYRLNYQGYIWKSLYDFGTTFKTGMWQNDARSDTPRGPAYVLRAMYTLTGDTGATKRSFATSKLDYTITGLQPPDSTQTLNTQAGQAIIDQHGESFYVGGAPSSGGQHMLFQNSAGQFHLYVWNSQQNPGGTPATVTITFNNHVMSSVTHYNITSTPATNRTAVTTQSTVSSLSFSLDASVHLFVINY